MESGMTVSWETCPEELLWMILKYSSSECLASCMVVNRRWNAIVLDYIESRSQWRKIALEAMVNKGRTFIGKSVLDYKNVLMNSMLWRYVSQAEIKLQHIYIHPYITRIQVFKETMILTVDMQNTNRYYNIPNKQLKRSVHSLVKKLDMSENEYMCVNAMDGYAHGKENPNDPMNNDDNLFRFKFYILVYTLVANVCYIVTKDHVVWALTWELNTWYLASRGRYFGSSIDTTCGVQVYNDRICLITKLGFIWCEEKPIKRYMKQNCYNLVRRVHESNLLVLFCERGFAMSMKNSDERVRVGYERMSKVVWLECGDMTCATEHGDTLFIGYKDGTVAICTPLTMTPTRGQLDRMFNVQEFDSSIIEPSIVGVDVFEDKLSHHLLVATKHKVLQLLITYPDHIRSPFE